VGTAVPTKISCDKGIKHLTCWCFRNVIFKLAESFP